MISLASMADFYSSCFLAAVIFVWTVGDLAATSYFVGSFAIFLLRESWNCAFFVVLCLFEICLVAFFCVLLC